ncbi:unnamed protein product [Amoebophrya sp. A25]|nr:unnamed protein product [Amoebophrya sp. A25]|eukprot:GSA25T00020194001.1
MNDLSTPLAGRKEPPKKAERMLESAMKKRHPEDGGNEGPPKKKKKVSFSDKVSYAEEMKPSGGGPILVRTMAFDRQISSRLTKTVMHIPTYFEVVVKYAKGIAEAWVPLMILKGPNACAKTIECLRYPFDNRFVMYPIIGFGTFKIDRAGLEVIMGANGEKWSAFDFGYRLVDSAAVYENEMGLRKIKLPTPERTHLPEHPDPVKKHGYPDKVTAPFNRYPDPKDDKALKEAKYQVVTLNPDKGEFRLCNVEFLHLATEAGAMSGPIIQSKLWQTGHGRMGTMKAFNKTCQQAGLLQMPTKKVPHVVQTQPLDSYLVHWPGPKRGWPLKNNEDGTPGIMPADWNGADTRLETWTVMEELFMDGRVKIIGLCNYSLRQLRHIVENCRIQPMILQIEFHPLLQQKELRKYCGKQGILVQGYASLGGSEPKSKSGFTLTTNPTIVKVAKEVGRTPAQVLLRWALQSNVAIIPKSEKASRIEENTKVFDFSLPQEAMEEINALEDGTRLTWKQKDPDMEP